MSLLLPAGLVDAARTKVSIGSIATSGSTSGSLFASGLVAVPFYVVISASSAGASYTCYNGTAGSILFAGIAPAGVREFNYWASPGSLLDNKRLVLETGDGIGKSEFHVYAVVCKGGAPSSPLLQ